MLSSEERPSRAGKAPLKSLKVALSPLQCRAPVPGKPASRPPSDAIVLFNGSSLDEWERVGGGEPEWSVASGGFTVVAGSSSIQTKRKFADIQLHVEWRTPSLDVHSENLQTDHAVAIKDRVGVQLGMHQFLANSGIFLQERYEIQVLETYGAKTYVNGQAGSVYKQHIPLVTASRKPGEWQTYDIIFQAPRFGGDGSVVVPGRLTLLYNGVLIQNNVVLWGSTEFIGLPRYEAHGAAAIVLQSHVAVSQVSYRNVWVREL